jgi:hypothetical protein
MFIQFLRGAAAARDRSGEEAAAAARRVSARRRRLAGRPTRARCGAQFEPIEDLGSIRVLHLPRHLV